MCQMHVDILQDYNDNMTNMEKRFTCYTWFIQNKDGYFTLSDSRKIYPCIEWEIMGLFPLAPGEEKVVFCRSVD